MSSQGSLHGRKSYVTNRRGYHRGTHLADTLSASRDRQRVVLVAIRDFLHRMLRDSDKEVHEIWKKVNFFPKHTYPIFGLYGDRVPGVSP